MIETNAPRTGRARRGARLVRAPANGLSWAGPRRLDGGGGFRLI